MGTERDMTADEALAAINDGYEMLRDEFVAAVEQASGGKGKERHANNQPFDQQPILAITRLLDGHPCAALAYQIIKKTIEAGRLVKLRGTDAAVAETYGVMNYAGAMAIRLKELGEVFQSTPSRGGRLCATQSLISRALQRPVPRTCSIREPNVAFNYKTSNFITSKQ